LEPPPYPKKNVTDEGAAHAAYPWQQRRWEREEEERRQRQREREGEEEQQPPPTPATPGSPLTRWFRIFRRRTS